MNPRVAAWLRSRNLTPADIENDGEVRRVPNADGKPQLWTVEYVFWIEDQWRLWAESLGFKRSHGYRAHDCAMLNGHTVEAFDAWLQENAK